MAPPMGVQGRSFGREHEWLKMSAKTEGTFMSTQEVDSDAPSVRCIWCGESSGPGEPLEHIVPEAIGCPKDLILSKGEVCGRCNHGLAHLDQALVADFEVFAMMAGVPRKGGRPAAISSYGNLRTNSKNGHVEYHFNMGPGNTTMPNGQTLPPFRGRPRDVNATFTREGGQATIGFGVEFGASPKVARALVKMGAEYFCWVQGRELASQVIQGPVADFVRTGKGARPVILGNPDKTKYEHRFGQIGRVGEQGWYCLFRLAHFDVMVDLGPDQAAFDKWAEEMYRCFGREGWTTLPPAAFVRQ
jgi:hypothetical protein